MNWLIRFAILSFAINSILFPTIANSQDLSQVVDFADQQYKADNFEIAASEFNRALFFGHTEQDILFLKIASCYFNLKDFELSIAFYDKAYFATKSDSVKNEAVLGKSFSLIMENQWMLALSELMNMESIQYNQQRIKMNFLQGMAYFGLHKDDRAESAFHNCLQNLPEDSVNNTLIDKEFTLIRKSEKRFNPKTAWAMSLIVPGSGQTYSKEYKEAANSIILLSGLYYLTVSLATKISYLEALVVILPWFQRYYTGGANKAEKLALNKQLASRNNSYLSILDYLESQNLKQLKTVH